MLIGENYFGPFGDVEIRYNAIIFKPVSPLRFVLPGELGLTQFWPEKAKIDLGLFGASRISITCYS